MATITLAEIKASTRRLLQDDQYDGTVIAEAANWFVYEICNNNRLRMMEQSTSLDGSAGDTVIDFPEDMLAWISIYVTVPQVYSFSDNFVEYADFMVRFANFATVTAGQARNWTDFGRAMRFAQPLNVAHTFQLDYVREPVPMVNDTDECEFPARYAELIMRGTKARVMEIDEDYAEASQERALLDPLVTTFIRNEARGGGKTKPTVIRTGRMNARLRGSNDHVAGR